MAKTNLKPAPAFTAEGANAQKTTPYLELRRSVMACLLWESGFYESGESVADRIKGLAHRVTAQQLADVAQEARHMHNLRHAPLLLVRELARHKQAKGGIVANTLHTVISRADELPEFLALYWQAGKQPLSKQVKLGLARAFTKFDEYQLAKYNRDNTIKLRDVLFMVHAKPKDHEQSALWKRLVDGTIESPDTWENRLSGGEDPREVFTDLITRNRIGYSAALYNLRNMEKSGVDKRLVGEYLLGNKGIAKVLPFRFIAAARAVPAWEDIIEPAMLKAAAALEKLAGKTIILIDRSGSMGVALSKKSDLSRGDAAAALVVLLREICDDVEIWWFTSGSQTGTRDRSWLLQVAPRRGFALADQLNPLSAGTDLGGAVRAMLSRDYQRLIVLTDEQSATAVPQPTKGRNYMINVATDRNGVGYGHWTHIDGFSESVVRYIQELESTNLG